MLEALRSLVQLGELKLVMFDLDGTLVDSVPDLHAALEAMYAQLGLKSASEEQVRCWVGNGAQMLVRRALAYELVTPEEDERFDVAYSAFLDAYAASNGQKSQLYEGAAELLQDLSSTNIDVAIVTNKPARFTKPLLSQLSVHPELILSGDSLREKKPSPMPLLHCLEHFQVRASEALMVGDSRSDMQAARAAKVKTVAVSYGYNHGVSISHENPDLIVDSLMELR